MTLRSIEAVRKQVTVEVPRDRAFEAFTARMGAWWNPDHHIAEKAYVDLVIEPREGGAWYELDADGNRCPWGSVLAWEPHERVVLNWQINGQWSYDPDLVTELEVRFTAISGTATLVELEHRKLENLGAGAQDARERFDQPGGWQGVLDRLAEYV
jgi:uncharacterized protein YndB with AHSA1/START domain